MTTNDLLAYCLQELQNLPTCPKSSTLADTLECQDIFLDGKHRRQIPLDASQRPVPGLHLWLDATEHKLIQRLSHLDFVSVVSMNPGDAMISYNGQIIAMYERKRTDLLESIYSGRLASQRTRLLITSLLQPTPCQVHFIHERIQHYILTDKENKIVLGCQANMIQRDRVFWRETASVPETAVLLLRDMIGIADFHGKEMTLKVRGTKRRLPSSSGGAQSGRPQDLLTAESLYRTQLSCIPRVSHDMADSISKTFPSWKQLIQRYTEVGADKLVCEIADIRVERTSKKSRSTKAATTRRIGPKLANSIVALHCT
jgi:hypothetical protein